MDITVEDEWPWFKVVWGADRTDEEIGNIAKKYRATDTPGEEAAKFLGIYRGSVFLPISTKSIYFYRQHCQDELQAMAYYMQVRHILEAIDG